MPQWVALEVSQTLDWQQPPAQDVPSQTHDPPTHSFPVAHAAHAAPFVPQWALLDVSQPPASQHPSKQDEAVHTHVPLLQAKPVAQPEQVAPPVPHSPGF
jgi:hypothetical protein